MFLSTDTNYHKYSSINFCAMKKSQFNGIDSIIVEKYKAPIEKFNSNKDLQDWAGEKYDEVASADYSGRAYETKDGRKRALNQWISYLDDESNNFNNTLKYLVLKGIVSDIKPSNDKAIPPFNKSAFNETINEISGFDSKSQFNLKKMYLSNLKTPYLDEGRTGWVIIPSYLQDKDNFEDNVKKLQSLSYKTWCTNSYKAVPYLSKGEMHIYHEKGEPKCAIRFDDNTIIEIEGHKNDKIIPLEYINTCKEHIAEYEKEGYYQSSELLSQFLLTEQRHSAQKTIKKDLEIPIKNNDTEKILNYFDINTKKDTDGKLIISDYSQPVFLQYKKSSTIHDGRKFFTFSELGIDENALFKDIKKIEGNAEFASSNVTDLGILEEITGDTNFCNSKIIELVNLKKIGGNAQLSDSQIINLGNLEHIGGNLYMFRLMGLKSLGKLKEVGGGVNFFHSYITDFGSLEKIGGSADFMNLELENLGNIKEIGGTANFCNSKIKTLGKLASIGKDLNLSKASVESLGDLKFVGDRAFLRECDISNDDKQKLFDIAGEVIG